MYTEFFKLFEGYKTPAYNLDAFAAANRRTMEAFVSANQVIAESLQTIGQRNAEAVREGVEEFLNASRDLINGASPEAAANQSAAYTKNAFENSFGHLREVTELLTKSGYEAFDVLNKRFAENLEEAAANSNTARNFTGQQARKAGGQK